MGRPRFLHFMLRRVLPLYDSSGGRGAGFRGWWGSISQCGMLTQDLTTPGNPKGSSPDIVNLLLKKQRLKPIIYYSGVFYRKASSRQWELILFQLSICSSVNCHCPHCVFFNPRSEIALKPHCTQLSQHQSDKPALFKHQVPFGSCNQHRFIREKKSTSTSTSECSPQFPLPINAYDFL